MIESSIIEIVSTVGSRCTLNRCKSGKGGGYGICGQLIQHLHKPWPPVRRVAMPPGRPVLHFAQRLPFYRRCTVAAPVSNFLLLDGFSFRLVEEVNIFILTGTGRGTNHPMRPRASRTPASIPATVTTLLRKGAAGMGRLCWAVAALALLGWLLWRWV